MNNDMDIPSLLRDIKRELRLAMNGIASARMRESGMNYKLIFGVELPRLQQIAAEFPVNHELAQALWKENVRECNILAGLLQPVDTFYPEIADIWVESIRVPELAQLTVMNLFARLPYAADCAFRWMADERDMFQLCGFLLTARLLMQGAVLNEQAENEFLDQASSALQSPFLPVRQAARAALQKFMESSESAFQKGQQAAGISPE